MTEPGLGLEAHRPELTRHCARILGSSHDAEDATQETLTRAWRNLAGFNGRSTLRTWLYRIATNVCLDVLRARSSRPVQPSGTLPDQQPSSTGDPAETAETRDAIRLAFLAALCHLPPRQRAVVILRDVLGWSAAEVAQLLDTTVPAVHSAHQRARSTLAARTVTPIGPSELPSRTQRAKAGRYVDTFMRHDIDTLVGLVRQDALPMRGRA